MNRYYNLDTFITIVNDAQPINFVKEHWSAYCLTVSQDESIKYFVNVKNISKELIVYKKDLRLDCNPLTIIEEDFIKKTPEKYLVNYMDWAMRLCQFKFCDLLYIDKEISISYIDTIIEGKSYDKIYFLWPADYTDAAVDSYNSIKQYYPKSDITLYSLENLLTVDFFNLKPLINQIEDSLGYKIDDEENEFVKYIKKPWNGKVYTTMSHWLWCYNFLQYKKWI